jgi:hypothetical protein
MTTQPTPTLPNPARRRKQVPETEKTGSLKDWVTCFYPEETTTRKTMGSTHSELQLENASDKP